MLQKQYKKATKKPLKLDKNVLGKDQSANSTTLFPRGGGMLWARLVIPKRGRRTMAARTDFLEGGEKGIT